MEEREKGIGRKDDRMRERMKHSRGHSVCEIGKKERLGETI